MSKGNLYIISAASGTGKDTLLKKVFERHPEIKFSISSVTRKRREGENDGGKYNFVTVEQFENMIKNDELLEYNNFVGNYYGTPKKPVIDCINAGNDIILEIDVNGAEQIRKKIPDAISIFIMPPTYSELKRRLSSRGTDSEEVIGERLNVALNEIKRAKEFDYIVVNDNINTAVEDFLSIILSHRITIEKQKHLINEVLEKC